MNEEAIEAKRKLHLLIDITLTDLYLVALLRRYRASVTYDNVDDLMVTSHFIVFAVKVLLLLFLLFHDYSALLTIYLITVTIRILSSKFESFNSLTGTPSKLI